MYPPTGRHLHSKLHSETLNPRRAAVDLREQTLHQLAHQSAEWAYRIAYDLLGSRAEAEDAVQEALARSCASVDRLRDQRAANAWFKRITINVCLKTLRRRKLKRTLRNLLPGSAEPSVVIADSASEHSPPELQPDAVVARSSDIRHMLRSLESLPGKQRAALVLRYGQDMSIAEVAELLGIGEGTVKTHLVRGLRRLRQTMEKQR